MFAASRDLLLSWCPDVAIIKGGEYTLFLLSVCSILCIKSGHRMILENASSGIKISTMNLPMYLNRIFDLYIEGQGR